MDHSWNMNHVSSSFSMRRANFDSVNEDKAAIERRREAVGSLENKGNASVAQSPARSLARGRRDWNKSEGTATLLRIHIARQLPVSNNSQADCSCIIKGTKLISWRIHGERERGKKWHRSSSREIAWIFVEKRIVKRTSLDYYEIYAHKYLFTKDTGCDI